MIPYLCKGVLSGLAVSALASYRRLSVELLRIEAAKWYLHGVRVARLSAIGLVRTGLAIALICVGVVLLHAGLFILLPWTLQAKAALGMLLGLAYVVIGYVALRAGTSERKWMEASGAAEMLAGATGRSREA